MCEWIKSMPCLQFSFDTSVMRTGKRNCYMFHKFEDSNIMEVVRETVISEKPLHRMGYRCIKHSPVLIHVDCNILVLLSKVPKIALYWFCVVCLVFKYFKQYFRSNHHHWVCSTRQILCKHNSLRLYVLLMISSWSFCQTYMWGDPKITGFIFFNGLLGFILLQL